MSLSLSKPDTLGALASSLCVVHCVATPFLFIAQSCSTTCCEATPAWWQWLDYLFLAVSFLAILQSTRTSSNNFIKYSLWVNWIALFGIIINKNLEIFFIPEITMHVVAISLASLHIYNLNYCQCKNEKCCTNYE